MNLSDSMNRNEAYRLAKSLLYTYFTELEMVRDGSDATVVPFQCDPLNRSLDEHVVIIGRTEIGNSTIEGVLGKKDFSRYVSGVVLSIESDVKAAREGRFGERSLN